MIFKEVLAQVIAWLQQDKWVSYGALKRSLGWMTRRWRIYKQPS